MPCATAERCPPARLRVRTKAKTAHVDGRLVGVRKGHLRPPKTYRTWSKVVVGGTTRIVDRCAGS